MSDDSIIESDEEENPDLSEAVDSIGPESVTTISVAKRLFAVDITYQD